MKEFKSNIPLFTLRKNKDNVKKVQISCSSDIYKYSKNFYNDDIEIYESMFLVMLNRSNNTVGYSKISQGGITGTVVDVKLISKYALDSLSSSVILIHNHPSGNLNPSNEDKNITNKVKEALKVFDMQVLDHLIVTDKGYYSFADENII